MPRSSSSSQLAKDIMPLMEEVSLPLSFMKFEILLLYCFETLSLLFMVQPDIDSLTWTASSDASIG